MKLAILNACYHDKGSFARTEHAQEVPMDGGQQQQPPTDPSIFPVSSINNA